MTIKNGLKRAVSWPIMILCIFSIGSASVLLGDQPADAVHNGNLEISGRETTDFARGSLSGPSASPLEKAERLTPAPSARPARLNLSGKVTASWYGSDHQNRLTANGQRFQMHKNTLAHRTWPLGTRVRLINPDNGKSVEGIVNDRGPYIKGRDVDVSYAIARQLGFVKKGVMKLDIEMM